MARKKVAKKKPETEQAATTPAAKSRTKKKECLDCSYHLAAQAKKCSKCGSENIRWRKGFEPDVKAATKEELRAEKQPATQQATEQTNLDLDTIFALQDEMIVLRKKYESVADKDFVAIAQRATR